jgi:hypothetical protein
MPHWQSYAPGIKQNAKAVRIMSLYLWGTESSGDKKYYIDEISVIRQFSSFYATDMIKHVT